MAEEDQPQMPDVARELRALLARLPAALDPEAAAGVQGLIQFNLTGEGGGAYFLALRDGTCTVSEGRHPAPTVILTLNAADCVGVISGTVKARVLFEAGRLQVAGNAFLALMLRDLFPRERLRP